MELLQELKEVRLHEMSGHAQEYVLEVIFQLMNDGLDVMRERAKDPRFSDDFVSIDIDCAEASLMSAHVWLYQALGYTSVGEVEKICDAVIPNTDK